MTRLSNAAKNWLGFASNGQHGSGSSQILRFLLTTPINHTYTVDHVLSAHVHYYTCKSHISMQIGKMQIQCVGYVLHRALVISAMY